MRSVYAMLNFCLRGGGWKKDLISLNQRGSPASAFLEFTCVANSYPHPAPSVLFADNSDDLRT